MSADKVEESVFSTDLIEQKEFVEQQCFILQNMIDSSLKNKSTSFVWCSHRMQIIITDDLFQRKRKIRQVMNDDNDSDDDKQDSVRLKFDIKSPNDSNSSLPTETITFEIDNSSQSEEQENNVPLNNVREIESEINNLFN
jgi:hypothetical protein